MKWNSCGLYTFPLLLVKGKSHLHLLQRILGNKSLLWKSWIYLKIRHSVMRGEEQAGIWRTVRVYFEVLSISSILRDCVSKSEPYLAVHSTVVNESDFMCEERDANWHSAAFAYSKRVKCRDDHREHPSAEGPNDNSIAAPPPGTWNWGRCAETSGHSRWWEVSTTIHPLFAHRHNCFKIWSSSRPPGPFPIFLHEMNSSLNKIIAHLILSWYLSTWEPRLRKQYLGKKTMPSL